MHGRHAAWLFVGVAIAAAGCGAVPAAWTASVSPSAAARVVVPAAAPDRSRLGFAVSTTGTSGTPVGRPTALKIGESSLRLPTPTTRAVAFPSGSGIVVAGGLTATGTTGRVIRIPLDGRPATMIGRLAYPVHDAGGALAGGSMLVLGGGDVTQDAWVQRVVVDGRSETPGRLPAARADLAAVTAGSQIVVLGGGASGRADPRVLATSDGRRFRVVAILPIAVRYAAVAVVGSTILVLGGVTVAGDTAAIQSVDLARGTVAVVGRLPQAMSHETALVVGGVVVLAGGRHGGKALDGVLEVDPASYAVRAGGRLPRAESDAAGVVVGGVGYLVGGEAARPLATVVTIAVAS